jgi:UDP-2,4-diacetamido-2,4,6-trideoxy-beta-L-altropyranose hydrolase
LFVSLGANDPFGICQMVVEALRMLGTDAPGAEIVVGTDEKLRAQIANLASNLSDVHVHGFVDDMAALMARCTIALGAGGSSTWERCSLGLPSLVVITADNQRRMAQDLAQAQIIVLLGEAAAVSANTLARSIAQLRDELWRQSEMRVAGMALVDGHGVGRVADLLEMSSCTS